MLRTSKRVDDPRGVVGVQSHHACNHHARTNIKTQAAAGASGSSNVPAQSYPLTQVLTCVAVACAGAFAFGYHLAIVNGPLEQIALDLGFAGNTALQGAVVSTTLAGAALGSMSGGGLADSFGRRKAFLLTCLPLMAGPLICAWASTFNHLAIGRFVTGVAIGLSSALVPTYISEVAPTRLRGTLGTLNQLVICIGILAVLLVNMAFPVTQWRTFFLMATAPAAILLLGMLAAPESPRWLLSKGAAASAQEAARRLWGPQAGDELGTTGAAATTKPAAAPTSADTGVFGLFGPKYRRGVVIGLVLFAIQQFAGINALVYFSSAVFRQAGVTSDTLASAAVGATNVLGTLLAAGIIEKAGRKQLLVGSYVGQAAAMLTMAAAFTLPALKALSAPVAVLGTLAYILSFAMGAGPVTALAVAELNPLEVRGRAVAAALTSHWICNVAVGQVFMGAVTKYGLASVYTGFGAVALLGALYVSSQVPETKGKTFDQISAELGA